MTLNSIKRSIQKYLPKWLFDSIQGIRRIGHRPSDLVVKFKDEFDRRNAGNRDDDSIVLRDGLAIKVDKESVEPFSWFCWRSPDMVKELDFFINRVCGVQAFADVGANHGIFSLVFLKLNPSGKVLSVDPSPLADRIRLNNRTLNGMESALFSCQVACGAVEGAVDMHFNWHHLEVSGKGDENLETVTVPVRPLDALCRESGITPEVVKIDVEGFELEVLKGADGVLRNAKLLLLEVHPELLEKLNVAAGDIFDWLTTRAWLVKTLEGREITRRDFCDRIHTFWTICEH